MPPVPTNHRRVAGATPPGIRQPPTGPTACRWPLGDDAELRPLEEGQAGPVFRLTERNRERLRQWLPWVDAVRCEADTARFIAEGQRQWVEQRGMQAGIWRAGGVRGVIGFQDVDLSHRSASLGYWLDVDHQGKGLMTAACDALVRHAFTCWQWHRVVIRCAAGNHRSRAIPERLGFRFEGVARQAMWLYDHYVDMAIYARLRTDPELARLCHFDPR